MDGNRRYSKKLNIPIQAGHTNGADTLKEILEYCLKLKIKNVTVYAFSIENFNRSQEEVARIMDLCKVKLDELGENCNIVNGQGIQIRIHGEKSLLPESVRESCTNVTIKTLQNSMGKLNVCMPYTSRHEISCAINEIVAGEISLNDVDPNLIEKCLFVDESVDILVRTSGEVRLSDFMLWQASTACHIHFLNVFWPDFTIWHLIPALIQYQISHNRLQNNRKVETELMGYKPLKPHVQEFVKNVAKKRSFKPTLIQQQLANQVDDQFDKTIPEPPKKNENYSSETPVAEEGTSSARKIKSGDGMGLAGHPFVKQIREKNALMELKIEDLDEKMLKLRLEAVSKDLAYYKQKCKECKADNEVFRNEIESTEQDTVMYVEYLKEKKREKEATIESLHETKKKDMQAFLLKRQEKEQENKLKISELQSLINDLEIKLESKQQTMMGLSEIIAKRVRHEAEILKIKQEIAEADKIHEEKSNALERTLLETRIRLQREAEAKIREMENAAQERAEKFLSDHTAALTNENKKLERDLKLCYVRTQELLAKRDRIEKENKLFERQQKLQEDLLRIRIEKVMKAQKKAEKARKNRKVRVDSLPVLSSDLPRKSTLHHQKERTVAKLTILAGVDQKAGGDEKATEKNLDEFHWDPDMDDDDEYVLE